MVFVRTSHAPQPFGNRLLPLDSNTSLHLVSFYMYIVTHEAWLEGNGHQKGGVRMIHIKLVHQRVAGVGGIFLLLSNTLSIAFDIS